MMNLIRQRTFQTRALTALVFVAVMVAGLCWNAWSFLVLFSVIHFGCWYEFLRLLEKIQGVRYNSYSKLGFPVLGYSLLLFVAGDAYQLGAYGLRTSLAFPVSVAGFVLLAVGIIGSRQIKWKVYAAAATGWIYISLTWALFVDLYIRVADLQVGDTFYITPVFFFPVVIIASIWVNDTMAYITGSMIGKTALTKISPKKTWEGTIGGILLSMLAVSLLVPFVALGFFDKKFAFFLLVLAAVVSITGTFGDLLESWLKRKARVKDSGQLMPGHGGFLDRFDSLLVAIPFAWLLIRLLFTQTLTP